VLGLSGFSRLILRWNELFLSPEQQRNFFSMVERRASGEPVAYIMGREKFCGSWFTVSPAVLIPRPETEFMVELFQRRHAEKFGTEVQKNGLILDLCCGSGALALTLKRLYPEYEVVGTDICPEALEVARYNCEQQKLEVSFLQADLLQGFRLSLFDYIVCNPPYLRESEKSEMTADVLCFEPCKALFSDSGGLGHIMEVLERAAFVLRPGGELYLEIGADQAEQVKVMAEEYDLIFAESYFDFRGIERILVFCRK
jgi:release factor glutamine methyltransferase